MLKIVISLTKEEKSILCRPVRGQGGFQSLLRRIKSQPKNNNEFSITPSGIERIYRYASEYGGGGFQQRLDIIRDKLFPLTSNKKIKGNKVSANEGYYVAVKYAITEGEYNIIIREVLMGELFKEDWERREGTQWAILKPEAEKRLRRIYHDESIL